MFGGMQDFELRVPRLLDHAEREHGSRELVTAWANRDGADPVIRAVLLRGGSGDVREVDRDTTPTNQRVRVAADRAGNAAVSWAAPYEAPVEGSYLALRAPDGSFGEPEFVPTGSQTYPGPAVAFDPRSGTPAAVFATEPAGYGEDGPVWFTERR